MKTLIENPEVNQIKCLIVDDTSTWQEIFAQPLRDSGHKVHITPSLDEAFDRINKNFYHVAVVDLALDPDNDKNTDGLKVLQKLSDLGEGTQSMLISGVGTMQIGWQAGIYGAAEVIEKGKFDADSYALAVKLALDRAQAILGRYHVQPEFFGGTANPTIWSTNVLMFLKMKKGYVTLDEFISRLLRRFEPLLAPLGNPEALIDRQKRIVAAHCWSKGVGHAIDVRFGCVTRLEEIQTHSSETVLRAVTHDELIGYVARRADSVVGDYEPRTRGQRW